MYIYFTTVQLVRTTLVAVFIALKLTEVESQNLKIISRTAGNMSTVLTVNTHCAPGVAY